ALARLLAATGNDGAALDALDTAESHYLSGFFPDVQPLHATRARLWIRSGRLDEARAWAAEHESATTDSSYRSEYVRLTLARLDIATEAAHAPALDGRDHHADLEEVVHAARVTGRVGSLVEGLLLLALSRAARADTMAAHLATEEALHLAVPAGYRRLFLDEGPAAESLLRGYLREHPRGPVGRMADLVLSNGEGRAVAAPRILVGGEQLSERELEVTALLATDLTGPEI